MAIIHKQQDNRTELQKRIAAELSEKAKKREKPTHERPDGVDDSEYIKGTKTTTSRAWVWIFLVTIVVVAAVWYMVASMASGNNA